MFFESKWADLLMPNIANLETQSSISHRMLKRGRVQLAKLGLPDYNQSSTGI